MNQILAPLYYLECQTDNPYNQSQVFFMFSALMNFSIDMHIKQIDGSEQGQWMYYHSDSILKSSGFIDMDQTVVINIMAEHYSLRCLALLLSQQFQLHDTMRNIQQVLLDFQISDKSYIIRLNNIIQTYLEFKKLFPYDNNLINWLFNELQQLHLNAILNTQNNIQFCFDNLGFGFVVLNDGRL